MFGEGINVREKESENMKLRQFAKNQVFSGEHYIHTILACCGSLYPDNFWLEISVVFRMSG